MKTGEVVRPSPAIAARERRGIAEATCLHCGTRFAVRDSREPYCCAGCAFVARLIRDGGFERYYDLKGNATTAPVRGGVFQPKDWSWLVSIARKAEEETAAEGLDRAVLRLGIRGLSCIGCVWLVERLFEGREGALGIRAGAQTGDLWLEWVRGQFRIEEFAAELQRFGYELVEAAAEDDADAKALLRRAGLCGAFALNAMAFSLPRYLGMPPDFPLARLFVLTAAASATLALLAGGSYFMQRAWESLRRKVLHIDSPIALGITSAYLGALAGWALEVESLLYFDFVATFIFLMLGGRWLQLRAVNRNRSRFRSGAHSGGQYRLAGAPGLAGAEAIEKGRRFWVRPGQCVPVSARLTDAGATLSLESINGEAEPVVWERGRRVPAGAVLVGSSEAEFEAVEAWQDSLLRRLQEIGRQEPPRQRSLERLLRRYLAIVVAAGLAGGAAWLWATGDPARALQVMISTWVVSCPCALGVAAPLADSLAAAQLEKVGVFVRRPGLWRRLRRVRKVLFDKTGTLTLEHPHLENPEVLESLSHEARVRFWELVEGSLHPVSRMLAEALGGRWPEVARAGTSGSEPQEIPGSGLRMVDGSGAEWKLGRADWASGGSCDASAAVLSRDGEALAEFRYSEEIRPETREVCEHLRRGGMRIYILSGDGEEAVGDLARRLGVAPGDAQFRLSPEAKLEWVRAVDRGDTLYLGDGLNDSLAFTAASVTGTPVVDRAALARNADFHFLGRSLSFLPRLLATAERHGRAVRMVFGFAVSYNAVAATLCLAGLMNPLFAAVLMPVSSVVSLGLARWRMGKRTG